MLGDQIYIAKEDLPPALRNRLVRLAAFQNPEFYRAQAMRLSTFGKPRVIHCAEDGPKYLALPRGCLERRKACFPLWGSRRRCAMNALPAPRSTCVSMASCGRNSSWRRRPWRLTTSESWPPPRPLAKPFLPPGLSPVAASTAWFWCIGSNCWNNGWSGWPSFLDVPAKSIGRLGGGRRTLTGRIDVALIQSLVRKGVVHDCVGSYGHLVVDECHHLSASSFELVARRAKARYVTGLSASITRKDGHHPIIFMQCGPVRYRDNARQQAAARPFTHHVLVRPTGFRAPDLAAADSRVEFQRLYEALTQNAARNN